jgi:hypothetical protein
MDLTEGSETSAKHNLTPGKYSKEHIQHSVSAIKTNQLMQYREIIAVCAKIHTKHINTLCGQKVGFVNVKFGGTYSDQWVLYV